MSDSNGCYTAPELADRYQIPISLARRLIDRLELGTRVNSCRVIFTEDLSAIELALKAMGKLPASEPIPEQSELVAEVTG